MDNCRRNTGGLSRLMILVLALMVLVTFSLSTGFAFGDTKDDQEEETEVRTNQDTSWLVPSHKVRVADTYVYNTLTGEWGFDESRVIDTRIVGVVVENHPAARPQWGMDDKNYAPDVILEGEVEGGISRMLWMWADYTKMPEIVGPVRSARPPYIKFSELFDAFFVHWGMSKTTEEYVGADTVFKTDKVDHLNGSAYESSGPFGRLWSTGRAQEHLAIVYGNKLPKYLEKKFETARRPEITTALKFYRDKQPRGEKGTCYDLTVTFSNRSKSTHWTYNRSTRKYYTGDFKTNVTRDNLLILMDNTNYITKPGYTTYCNYNFVGGDAYFASCGALENIKWRVKHGKLLLYRNATILKPNGSIATIEAPVALNPGTTYIGWASSNNGGSVRISGGEPDPEPVKYFIYDQPQYFRGYR